MDPNDADSFAISGPAHLRKKVGDDGSTCSSEELQIDWKKEEHRRCVAACLAKGTYVLENDRRNGRAKPLAPAWWESFDFRMHTVLKDKGTIFGAVFELPADDDQRLQHPCAAPRYVVAFRGTNKTNPSDLLHDVFVLTNILEHYSWRYQHAQEEVGKLLLATGSAADDDVSVWLTGHSLGASMALYLGRALMADKGRNLPTFLFNPPQVSLRPAMSFLSGLMNLPVAGPLDKASCWFKVVVGGSKVLKPDHRESRVSLFKKLSPWVPELYVNEGDLICNGFIGQFDQRLKVEENNHDLHDLAMFSMTLSFRDMFVSSLLGKEMEQPHLLPSARLWRSKSEGSSVLSAHEIQQWWKQDAELGVITRSYSYPLTNNETAAAAAAAISDT